MKPIFFVLLLLVILGGCAGAPRPPKDLSIVERTWSTNADGYIFTVGYFTEPELLDRRWEAKRTKSRKLAKICDSEKVVRRDVRWGRAADGPMCAKVIYSITCGKRRPDWGGSLTYDRDEAVMQDVTPPPGPSCGDKFVRSAELTDAEKERRRADELQETVGDVAKCEIGPDVGEGKFLLSPGTRFSRQTRIAAGLRSLLGRYWAPSEPDDLLRFAASNTQAVHTVFTRTALVDDGTNVLISLDFANNENGSPYCVTLKAVQGQTRWRKTVRREQLLSPKLKKVDAFGHPVDAHVYWDPNTDAHALAEELAVYMGLDVGKDHQGALRR